MEKAMIRTIAPLILTLIAAMTLAGCPAPASTGNSGDGTVSGTDGVGQTAKPTPSPAPVATPAPEPTPDPGAAAVDASPYDQVLVKPEAEIGADALKAVLETFADGPVDLRPSTLGWFVATFEPTDPPRGEAEQTDLAARVKDLIEVKGADPNKVMGPAGESQP
jgi:hypothetical protein